MSAEDIALGFRELAALWEQEPSLPEPFLTGTSVWLTFWGYDGKDPAAEVRRVAKLIGGRWHKNDPSKSDWEAENYTLRHDHKFGPFELVLIAKRERVCVRKEVGERVVEVEAQPAVDAHTKVEKVYAWECVPLLADAERELTVPLGELEGARR